MTQPIILTALYVISILGISGVLFHLLPRLSRPEIYFAVTVPPSFRNTNDALRILRRYRLGVWIHTLIPMGLLLAGSSRNRLALFLFPLAIVWQIAGWLVAFLAARRDALAFAVAPSTIREAEVAPRRASLPGGPLLQIGPLAVLAAAALYVRHRWEEIPLRFPVHWGMGGAPDRWASRTPSGVYGPLLVGTIVCAALLLLAYGILLGSRRLHASGPRGWQEEKFRRITLSILLAAEYCLALILAGVALLPLLMGPKGPEVALPIFMLLPFALLLAVLLLLVRTGQGGTRLPTPAQSPADTETQAAPVGDGTRDDCWKWGLFYVNRNDPALFVEKRFGVGYTLNFGNRWFWVILALALLIPLAAFLWSSAS